MWKTRFDQISLADGENEGREVATSGDYRPESPSIPMISAGIATQNAKNVNPPERSDEESRKSQLNEWQCREKEVVTGIVQRYIGRNVSVDLGKIDAILPESEQVKGEVFQRTERIKVYILEVKDNPKGPRISVSRTHPDL